MAARPPIDESIRQYQASHPATSASYLGLFTYLEGLGYQVERPTHAGGTLQSDDKIVDKTTGRVYDLFIDSDRLKNGGTAAWTVGDAGYWVNGKPSGTPPPAGSTPTPHPTEGTGPAPTTPPVPPTGTTAPPTTPAAPAATTARRPAPGPWESPSRSTVVTGPGLPVNQPKPNASRRPAYDDWSSPSRSDTVIGPPLGTTRPGATSPTATPAATTGAPAPGAETNPYPSAYDALARMRKRAGVGGRRSTILGGFAPGQPQTRPATILGRSLS